MGHFVFLIYLFILLVQALEMESVMITFQRVYDKLSQAFDGVPCDELGVSDEVKEQVGPFHISHLYQIFVLFICVRKIEFLFWKNELNV